MYPSRRRAASSPATRSLNYHMLSTPTPLATCAGIFLPNTHDVITAFILGALQRPTNPALAPCRLAPATQRIIPRKHLTEPLKDSASSPPNNIQPTLIKRSPPESHDRPLMQSASTPSSTASLASISPRPRSFFTPPAYHQASRYPRLYSGYLSALPHRAVSTKLPKKAG